MDSQKRDESRDRRREEALARRVGDALDQLAHHDAEECPDAELIAAYQEKSLQPDEIAQWEGHFAVCGRCRKILAVLAAAVEAPLAEKEVAHLGELIATTRATAQAGARPVETTRPNRLVWRTRWLAPALGVAAVLAVWLAMRPPWRTADQNPSGTLIAQAPKTEPPLSTESRTTERSSEVTPKKRSETDAEALKNRPDTRAQSLNPPMDALAKNRLDGGRVVGGVAPNAGASQSTLRDEKKEKTELNGAPNAGVAGREFGAPSAAAPPSALPAAMAKPPEPVPQAQAKALAPSQPPSVTETPGSVSQTVAVAEAAPLVETTNSALGGTLNASDVANLPMNGRNYQPLVELDAVGELPIQVKTPSGKILWRAGKGGNIQRLTNAGRTWILQVSPSQEDWLAGAAVSDTICWLAGRNGAIARTTDGGRWEKIAPPLLAVDPPGKLPDWIGISAAGAQTATITASDQRRYVTQDGGKTWRAQ